MTADLTRLPVRGLDDITREVLEREIRGAVYAGQSHLERARANGNRQMVRAAELHLAQMNRLARDEHVTISTDVQPADKPDGLSQSGAT